MNEVFSLILSMNKSIINLRLFTELATQKLTFKLLLTDKCKLNVITKLLFFITEGTIHNMRRGTEGDDLERAHLEFTLVEITLIGVTLKNGGRVCIIGENTLLQIFQAIKIL